MYHPIFPVFYLEPSVFFLLSHESFTFSSLVVVVV
jgi:hypothetical protein